MSSVHQREMSGKGRDDGILSYLRVCGENRNGCEVWTFRRTGPTSTLWAGGLLGTSQVKVEAVIVDLRE